MGSDLTILEKTLAVHFRKKELLEKALIHRSFLNENKSVPESNERLEFLGDSVLQVLVSTQLYSQFPEYTEGELTNLRSGLVRTQMLATLARKLNFGKFIRMSRGEEKGGGRDNQSLLADTFEAVLGAIYLDQGLPLAKKFLEQNLYPLIAEVNSARDQLDFKSRLQEVVQEEKQPAPSYRLLESFGPDHDKVFLVGVYVADGLLASARGKSKQEAEQEAARLALENKSGK